MKKLLAMLMGALFAIGSGMEYIAPKEDLFILNTDTGSFYWEMDVTNGVTGSSYYADLYRTTYQITDGSTPHCKTENVVPVRSGASPYTWKGSELFWFLQADSGADNEGDSGTVIRPSDWADYITGANEKGTKYDLADGKTFICSDLGVTENSYCYITTPCHGEVVMSHFSCEYGQTMKFQFLYNNTPWIMTVNNAVCWWCCRDKKPTEADVTAGYAKSVDGYFNKGRYSANTTDSLKGTAMPSGSLLCVGDKGTTITFSKASS